MKLQTWILMVMTVGLIACGRSEAEPSDGGTSGDAAAVDASTAAAAAADLETIVMTVPSMSCPLCARAIRVRLEEAGLTDVQVDLDSKRVRARFQPARIAAAEVEALVEDQGFPVTESRTGGGSEAEEGESP